MESINNPTIEQITEGRDLIKLLSARGTLEILFIFCCTDQRLRFLELNRILKPISTKTLAARLKELEKLYLVLRKAYNEIPPRVEYSLTEKGQTLADSLVPLLDWIANENYVRATH
jgi:DNA-binding HxlR family transcriptional regulator